MQTRCRSCSAAHMTKQPLAMAGFSRLLGQSTSDGRQRKVETQRCSAAQRSWRLGVQRDALHGVICGAGTAQGGRGMLAGGGGLQARSVGLARPRAARRARAAEAVVVTAMRWQRAGGCLMRWALASLSNGEGAGAGAGRGRQCQLAARRANWQRERDDAGPRVRFSGEHVNSQQPSPAMHIDAGAAPAWRRRTGVNSSRDDRPGDARARPAIHSAPARAIAPSALSSQPQLLPRAPPPRRQLLRRPARRRPPRAASPRAASASTRASHSCPRSSVRPSFASSAQTAALTSAHRLPGRRRFNIVAGPRAPGLAAGGSRHAPSRGPPSDLAATALPARACLTSPRPPHHRPARLTLCALPLARPRAPTSNESAPTTRPPTPSRPGRFEVTRPVYAVARPPRCQHSEPATDTSPGAPNWSWRPATILYITSTPNLHLDRGPYQHSAIVTANIALPIPGILRVAPGILWAACQSPAAAITRFAIHSRGAKRTAVWSPLGTCQLASTGCSAPPPHLLGGVVTKRHPSARAALHCVCIWKQRNGPGWRLIVSMFMFWFWIIVHAASVHLHHVLLIVASFDFGLDPPDLALFTCPTAPSQPQPLLAHPLPPSIN